MRLNPRALMVFCVVAELRSLSKAVEVLNLSQPAISKTLKLLEDVVRQPLYERSPQGICLTEAGKDLLPYACAVSQSLGQATRYIDTLRNRPTPQVRIGLSWSLIPRYQVELVRWAEDHRQSAQMELVHGTTLELIAKVYQRQVEAALVLGGDGLPEPLEALRFTTDEAVIITSPNHAWAHIDKVTLGMFEGSRVLVPQRTSRLRQRLEQVLEHYGIVPQHWVECGSLFGVKHAASQGLGIGIACRSFIKSEVDAGQLKSFPIEESGFVLGVSWVTQPQSTLALSTREQLKSIVQALEA